jgi:hypothetical protein
MARNSLQQMRIPEGATSDHRGLGPKSLRSFSADKRLSVNGRHLQLAQTCRSRAGLLSFFRMLKPPNEPAAPQSAWERARAGSSEAPWGRVRAKGF